MPIISSSHGSGLWVSERCRGKCRTVFPILLYHNRLSQFIIFIPIIVCELKWIRNVLSWIWGPVVIRQDNCWIHESEADHICTTRKYDQSVVYFWIASQQTYGTGWLIDATYSFSQEPELLFIIRVMMFISKLWVDYNHFLVWWRISFERLCKWVDDWIPSLCWYMWTSSAICWDDCWAHCVEGDQFQSLDQQIDWAFVWISPTYVSERDHCLH